MVMRNRESIELAKKESSRTQLVSSVRKTRICQKGTEILTELEKTRCGRLIIVILNVDEAGVYSQSKAEDNSLSLNAH